MKKVFLSIIMIFFVKNIFASTPAMPEFPVKYETWINHQHFQNCNIDFDFHNFETSFTKQVCGFNSNCIGSWYGYKISKYIITHRELINSSVPFCFDFSEQSFKKKKILQESMKTLELIYGDKSIKLNELICTTNIYVNKKSNYFSMAFLGYLDIQTFIELSKSEKLILQFEIDGEKYKFNLQIPVLYEETFEINNL